MISSIFPQAQHAPAKTLLLYIYTRQTLKFIPAETRNNISNSSPVTPMTYHRGTKPTNWEHLRIMIWFSVLPHWEDLPGNNNNNKEMKLIISDSISTSDSNNNKRYRVAHVFRVDNIMTLSSSPINRGMFCHDVPCTYLKIFLFAQLDDTIVNLLIY